MTEPTNDGLYEPPDETDEPICVQCEGRGWLTDDEGLEYECPQCDGFGSIGPPDDPRADMPLPGEDY